jgi:hypothetical protein
MNANEREAAVLELSEAILFAEKESNPMDHVYLLGLKTGLHLALGPILLGQLIDEAHELIESNKGE